MAQSLAHQLIDKDIFWFEEPRMMLMWRVMTNSNIGTSVFCLRASLVLARHAQCYNQLCVIKNRGVTLSEHQPLLDTVFDSYQIVDDGWRGLVQLDDSELVKWSLWVGSH